MEHATEILALSNADGSSGKQINYPNGMESADLL